VITPNATTKMENSKFCPECGIEFNPNAKFCFRCGTQL